MPTYSSLPLLLLFAAASSLSGCSGGGGEERVQERPQEREGDDTIQGISLETPAANTAPGEDDSGGVEGEATGSAAIDALAQGLGDVAVKGSVKGIDDLGRDLQTHAGVRAITWADISMEGEPMEDILDKLLYPDQYEEGEYDLPERIASLEDRRVAIVGYQIPLEWDGTTIPEFMLVGDLLGCCFGGAPMPDQWIDVKMVAEGAEYFPYIPVIVTGTLRIEGIADEAGYASGCYTIEADSVVQEQ